MKKIYFLFVPFLILHLTCFSQDWSEIQSNTEISSLFMIDEQVGYAISFSSKLKTNDGGETWTHLEMPYVPSNPQLHVLFNSMSPKAIHFFNQNEGYITGVTKDHNIVASTTDGGITWSIPYQEARGQQYDAGYTDIHFNTTAQGIMVGDSVSFP